MCLAVCRLAVTACLVILLASAEKVTITDGEGLNSYLCSPKGTITPNTSLVLSVATLYVTHDFGWDFCLVENTTNITIAASDELVTDRSSYVTVRCEGLVGFGFFNVSHLTIRSVHFENCESFVPPPALRYITGDSLSALYKFHYPVWASLFFNHCYNLILYNVLAAHNIDSVALPIIMGVNLCGSSDITTITNGNPPIASLSIFYVDSLYASDIQSCSLHISSNIFLSYNNDTIDMYVYLAQEEYDVHMAIQIKSRQIINDLMICIVKITFVDDSVSHSMVTFQGYPESVCINNYQGGLVPVKLALKFTGTSDPTRINDASVLIHNTAFPYEIDIGGLDISFSENINLINITNVSICAYFSQLDEYAKYPLLYARSASSGSTLTIESINISVHYSSEHYSGSERYAMMILDTVNVHLKGTNTFKSDHVGASAIHCFDSNVTVSGNLTISNNYSYGNIGINLRSSQLFLKEPLNATFYNRGISSGSAIYVPYGDACDKYDSFIRIMPIAEYSLSNLSSIDIALYFKNSSDGCTDSEGTQVYAPNLNFGQDHTISRFFQFNSTTWDSVHSQYAYTTLIDTIFKEINDYDKYISLSNGICYKVYGRHPWICKYIDYYYFGKNVSVIVIDPVYPGDIAFSTPVLNSDYHIIKFYPNYTYLQIIEATFGPKLETLYKAYACPDNRTSTINITFIIQAFSMDERPIIRINLHLDCPTGFKLTKDVIQCSCKCVPVLQNHGYYCNISTRLISSPLGYWTEIKSYDNTTTLQISKYCPPHFCNASLKYFYLDESLADLFCLKNRTGVLCGQCRDNHSAVFGSDECKPCSNLYLLTFPAYALAGVLLVTLLFALRLTVATGTILGPVFYANILALVLDTLTQSYHGAFYQIARIVISLLNLELGFPLCLYNGMTPTAAVGLQFVFPVYLWSIVGGIIILSRHSVRLSNLISMSSVQVLATLLYLSFASLLRMVIVVVTSTTIEQTVIDSANDTTQLTEKRLVWFYNGHISYGSGIHGLYLALVFLFVVLYLLPFTVFTTFSHHLLRFGLVNKMRPFIDAFGGPFKDRWRVWFGLHLWVVILLTSVSSALQGSHARTLLTIHLGVVGMFSMLQAYVRPFKNFLVGLFNTTFMALYFVLLESYLLFEDEFFRSFVILQSIAFFILCATLCHHLWLVKLLESLKRKVYVKFCGRK